MSRELPTVFLVLINFSCEPETNRASFDVGLTVFSSHLNNSQGGTSTGDTRPMVRPV